MAETLVKDRICYACGVDVRKGALFCYNCGGAVAPEIPLETKNKNLSNTWVHQNVAEIEREDRAEESKEITPEASQAKEKTTKKSDLQEYIKMDSAANMRRKPKTLQKRRVEEVVWEEYESGSNGWFIFFAFILMLFAIGVFYLARYLK
jgi:uncharacterized Zn finger protein (UPF0148 family)